MFKYEYKKENITLKIKMFSLTLNVALTAVLYKNWVDISNYINKKAHICTLLGRCEFSQYIWQNHVCGFVISYIYYKLFICKKSRNSVKFMLS